MAVNGSKCGLEVVKYASKILSPQNADVVLFHVHNKIPQCYWDLEREASPAWRMKEVRTWEREHEKMLEDVMDKANKTLWRTGFPKDSVKIKIHQKQEGIAQDIIREAQCGYSCVVVGKSRMRKPMHLCLGSLANRLVEKLVSVPILIVGEKPQPGALLLVLDVSENSCEWWIVREPQSAIPASR